MAQIQKLQAECEAKCTADKFYGMMKNNVNQLIVDFPENFKSIQVLEGDGVSVGSVTQWNVVLGGIPLANREKRTEVNDEKRSICWSFVGGDAMNLYNSFELKLAAVTPMSGGRSCLVKWSLEYEKAYENAPDPTDYLKVLEKIAAFSFP